MIWIGILLGAAKGSGSLPSIPVNDTNNVAFANVLSKEMAKHLADSGYKVIEVKDDGIIIEAFPYKGGPSLKMNLSPSLLGPGELNRLSIQIFFVIKNKYKSPKRREELLEWVNNLNSTYAFYKFALDNYADLVVSLTIPFEDNLEMSILHKTLSYTMKNLPLAILMGGGSVYLK
ncbi:MAG: YbjN domain-containing protein [candidate division WOR-3 bacterium]